MIGGSIDANIALMCLSYRWQFFIFMQNVSFSFSTFLEFGHPIYMFRKSVYQHQISSRSAPAMLPWQKSELSLETQRFQSVPR